jgi:hypothetical protein
MYAIPICILRLHAGPTKATDLAQSKTLLCAHRIARDYLPKKIISDNMRPKRRLESSGGKYILLIIALVLVVSSAATCSSARVRAARASTVVNLPPTNLTLIAADGTHLVLTSSDIRSLSSYTAYGGYETQGGFIMGLGNYTGVPLITLCNLIGGMANGNSLKITASDNYTQTFSYDEVNGNFTTFDTVTGQPVPHNQSLTPILAYYFDAANLSSAEGPLRLAIVGPEGLATRSAYWVKFVVKMEILRAPAGFPWLLLTIPVFISVVILVAAICRKRSGTVDRTSDANQKARVVACFQPRYDTRYRARMIRAVTKRPSAMRTTFNSLPSFTPRRVKAVFNPINT